MQLNNSLTLLILAYLRGLEVLNMLYIMKITYITQIVYAVKTNSR